MRHSLLLLVCASLPCTALEALDDAHLSTVSGQSGLTIETTLSEPNGQFLSTGDIRFTENDRDGKGEDYVNISGVAVKLQGLDAQGNVGGSAGLTTLLDVKDDGTLVIRNTDMGAVSLNVGAVSLSSRVLVDGLVIDQFKYAGDSSQLLSIGSDANGKLKVAVRNEFAAGSGFNFRYLEDGLSLSADVNFVPVDGSQYFVSELFVSANDDGLRIDFGETKGTIIVNSISLLDKNGNSLFSSGNFGDLGFGNIQVNKGYLTLASTTKDGRDGIEGVVYSDVVVGENFYRTGGFRVNAKDVSIKTNGEIAYSLDLIDTGFATGLEASISAADRSQGSDIDILVGGITFSNGDGTNETANSLGSFAIENLNLNDGSIDLGIYTLAGSGSSGMRVDISAEKAINFDVTLYDDSVADNAPKVTAEVVLNNVSMSQTIDQTKKGIHIGILDNSMDMNVNAIRLGNGQNYQGQTGRLVVNNLALKAGSYVRLEPLQ